MATQKKAAAKRAPRSAKQIHQEHVSRSAMEQAEAEAQDLEVTDASDYKAGIGRTSRKLKLPSGYVVLVRNPGMMFLVEQDLVPASLMDTIMKSMQGEKPDDKELVDFAKSQMGDVLTMARNVLVHCVVKPRILPTPEDEMDRDPVLLYADEVDEGDMMFIFNWVVGGTHDLERFQSELAAVVPAVSDS